MRNFDRRNQTEQNETAKRRLMEIIEESEKVKAVYPMFNLEKEFENPVFRRLAAAGVPVIAAFELIHRDEVNGLLIERAVRQAEKRISGSIQSGAERPTENGNSHKAAALTDFDPKNLSKEERKNIKERVRRGENVYLG